MSSHHYRPAYATRLGNLTAKSVLVRICDQVNDDGIGWPSIATIAKDTEIDKRTVLRVVEVFAAIRLITDRKRIEVDDRFGRRMVDAIFVDLSKLGQDLAGQFAVEYARTQGKCVRCRKSLPKCRCDRAEGVAATGQRVAATRIGVAATVPPDPHKGGTLFDLPLELTARARPGGRHLPFTAEQQEHLDRLAAQGGPSEDWARYYRDENCKAALAAQAAEEREAALRLEYPDRETAIRKVRKRCGFAMAPKGDELGPVLDSVFREQEELGRKPWEIAAQMVEMWLLQRSQGRRLRARYGPKNFFLEGHWLDSRGWHWDAEVLAAERAKVGSAR